MVCIGLVFRPHKYPPQLEEAVYIVTPVVSTATKPSGWDVNGGPYQRFSRVGGCGKAGHKQAPHVRGARMTVGILLGAGGGGSRRKSSQDVYPRAAPGGMRTGRAVVKNARRTLCENLVVTRVEFKLCPSEWK